MAGICLSSWEFIMLAQQASGYHLSLGVFFTSEQSMLGMADSYMADSFIDSAYEESTVDSSFTRPWKSHVADSLVDSTNDKASSETSLG